ncbi:MAG: formylmethanofuran--tetrahydromethanopterin N-formyltransferase [Candidatus Bathyarchaeia archaeon]|jgi:formylmethanofuran--tetrahydromethanopterin N-formyltransferase
MRAEFEDTYAEVFEGIYCRVVVTADDYEVLRSAAEDATATPSIVIGRVEGGVERWLKVEETPDGRIGVILQFWGGIDNKKPLQRSLDKFEAEISYRIRQDILVKPFTALFDASLDSVGRLDMMERVGHCGDGFEWEERRHGRSLIIVPLMVPDFVIERHLGYGKGVMGANFWYMCENKEAVMMAGKTALEAINGVEGVVAPFGICSAGSKPETRFPLIGPTTNHPYCPSLRVKPGATSKVPAGINFIPEIVINAVSLQAAKAAMKAGAEAAGSVRGVRLISAGNYGGKLGKYKIWLKEIL